MDPASTFRAARRHLGNLGIAFFICLFTLIFLFQPFKVEGTSMMPALRDQERILVNKLVYDVSPVRRGDLIVFRYPRDPRRSFIKRVIGLPGDVVQVRDGVVRVNGLPLAEGYLFAEPRTHERFGPERIEPGTYFVLGDHRSVSNDSRDWGVVPEEFLTGKAILRYWPPADFGPLR
jgi:signal peptidase I